MLLSEAQRCIGLVKDIPDADVQKKKDLRTKARRLMDQIERIRERKKHARTLPISEQKILWLSSVVNGQKFPPWTRTPDLDTFADVAEFHESYNLGLSEHQKTNFLKWGRPIEALPPPAWFTARQVSCCTAATLKYLVCPGWYSGSRDQLSYGLEQSFG